MNENENVYKHPEWKRLLEALGNKLEIGRLYTYKELEEAAGVDIHKPRGRRQFLHFAAEVLERESLHFENVRTEGYRVVQPKEQASCGMRHVVRGKRQIRHARKIVSNVRYEHMTAQEKVIAIDLAIRIRRLEEVVVEQSKEIKKLSRGVEFGRLPHPLLDMPKKVDDSN